jgi:large subunit ribosomal protein L7/L12
MASEKVNSIIESVEGLNVLELVELKKTMEEKWGVTAAAPMAFAAPGVAAGGVEVTNRATGERSTRSIEDTEALIRGS